jgi:Ca-activated chloride channel family protein
LQETKDLSLVKGQANLLVQEMVALFEATELFDEVLARVDAGDYEQARALADSTVTTLRYKQKYIVSDKLKQQEESIAAYSSEINRVKQMREEDKKIYQKSNKSVNYNAKKGKQ